MIVVIHSFMADASSPLKKFHMIVLILRKRAFKILDKVQITTILVNLAVGRAKGDPSTTRAWRQSIAPGTPNSTEMASDEPPGPRQFARVTRAHGRRTCGAISAGSTRHRSVSA